MMLERTQISADRTVTVSMGSWINLARYCIVDLALPDAALRFDGLRIVGLQTRSFSTLPLHELVALFALLHCAQYSR
jgi:hypothetical protein